MKGYSGDRKSHLLNAIYPFLLGVWIMVGSLISVSAQQKNSVPAVTGQKTPITRTQLVIYSQNIALVTQQFEGEITRTAPRLRLTPVPNQIILSSVMLTSLTDPDHFRVVRQQLFYQPLSREQLLKAHVGKTITLILSSGEVLEGTLLNYSGSEIVLQLADGIRVLPINDKVQFQFSSLNTEVYAQPTLEWEIAGLQKSKHTWQVRYLTHSIKWEVAYNAVLDDDQKALTLSSLVTIQNFTEAAFHNARTILVAGELNRTRSAPPVKMYREMQAMLESETPTVQEQPEFEYHTYHLPGPISIEPNSRIEIPFLSPQKFAYQKKYVFEAQNRSYVRVEVQFKNELSSGKATPLPAGVVRLYKQGANGWIYLGEDEIRHSPVGEKINLRVGYAFDLVGERRELSRKRVSRSVIEREVEVELRNHKKKEPVTVEVRERASGDWKILQSNFPYRRENISTVVFTVTIDPKASATLKYRIREAW